MKPTFVSQPEESEAVELVISGVDHHVLSDLTGAIEKHTGEGSFAVASIYGRTDKVLLEKIFGGHMLPGENAGIKLNPEQQHLLGLYFESIPAVQPGLDCFLVGRGDGYIFVSVDSSRDTSLIYPVPLLPKGEFGKDPRVVGGEYYYGDVNERNRAGQLANYSRGDRKLCGQTVCEIDQSHLQFKLPQVTDRPLEVAFLSLYPAQQSYPFQSVGPNYLEAYLYRELPGMVNVTHSETSLVYPTNIKAQLRRQKPDIIGISTKTNSHESLHYWMEYLSREFPDTCLVLGGQLANSSYREILAAYPKSLIVFDNGEVPFKQIVEIALGKTSPAHIGETANLAFNLDGQVLVTRYEESNWIAASHCVPTDTNVPEVLARGGIVGIRLSQGCWGACTFCTHPGKWFGAAIDEIIGVLKDWKGRFGLKGVTFTDDEIVNKDPQEARARIVELTDKLISANLGLTWTTNLRADCINWLDDHLVEKLKQAGCSSIFLGIESGSDTQLLRYGKPAAGVPVNAAINEKAIQLFARHDIRVGVGWIPFDPLMPTLREIKENIDFIERNDLLSQNIRLETSLRAQRGSAYAKKLGSYGLELLGELQPNMFHYDATYLDPRVGTIKDHMKSWIEGIKAFDTQMHAIKFALAVDPSHADKFHPVVEIGRKVQQLTLDYQKALIAVFPERLDDQLLDGAADPETRAVAQKALKDRKVMGERRFSLLSEVVQARDQLLAVTQRFVAERTALLDEHQTFGHSTTTVVAPGDHVELKTTRCTGLSYDWSYANRPGTGKGPDDDVVVIVPMLKRGGEDCLVFIETHRPPVQAEHGISTIEFPAGLVGNDIDTVSAADRILSGELGYEVLRLERLTRNCASSPGCTSETCSIFVADLGDVFTGRLGDPDVIKGSHVVPVSKAMEFLRQQGRQGKWASAQTYAALSFIFDGRFATG